MDSDEAPPPPYSTVDPLLVQANNRNAAASAEVNRVMDRLRGGDPALSDTPSSPASTSAGGDLITPTTSAAAFPAHFTSAAGYFTERRPPTTSTRERQVVEHCVNIYPRSQSKDFPRRPRCWSSRTEDITQQDWDVFLRHLFPAHLGLASVSTQLPRQLRAEIQRDRKDRPQETDEERKRRIAAVIAEWNQYFFEPRSGRVVYVYVMDATGAPRSSLCPRCYPAATNRAAQTPDAGRNRLQRPNPPPPAAEQPEAPPAANPPYSPGPYAYPNYPTPPTPAPYAPYPPPALYNPAVYPVQPQLYTYPAQPPAPYQQAPWGWNAPPYGVPYQDTGPSKGPLGWISSLADQAQRYGERFTEQAQHYGRQVEEQALAHSRWIEEQAGFQGRKISGFVSPPRDEWANHPPKPGYYQTQNAYPRPPAPVTSAPQQPIATQPDRPRRASIDSDASDQSFSSIDSLSTTSDLSASDLATVRAQLLSLTDHHDRKLYDAAVGLRRQLDLRQQSRRQIRAAERPGWRKGWGRRDSAQQQQQKQAEKQLVKEETRATRKAFRDVLRRAREEQREKRRMKRSRRRQEQRARQSQRDEGLDPQSQAQPLPLDQHMQHLDLDSNRESRSTVQSFTSFPSPVRSVAESEISEISSISTPSTRSSRASEKEKVSGRAEKGSTAGTEKSAPAPEKQATDPGKYNPPTDKDPDRPDRGPSRRN
ncbi:hypothetical protein BO70DRAFT_429388 [Aspergillus heteromorphus CBS 117.55]|uniref:Uncharacterized protein n=1 Tax=Aspergillus heteromorphus CBS 117.55 TaxID=1448321 RepID=A0A317W672_9EURO|nr:uncharacterized protein BO70DRAFT_429388 [Aspergillus heteromorphus CBS 117.55]PWY81853.1 hypothetical protein BO70DRAFT_429388 [Aspergillus heteromorphus CBS 117.55]